MANGQHAVGQPVEAPPGPGGDSLAQCARDGHRDQQVDGHGPEPGPERLVGRRVNGTTTEPSPTWT